MIAVQISNYSKADGLLLELNYIPTEIYDFSKARFVFVDVYPSKHVQNTPSTNGTKQYLPSSEYANILSKHLLTKTKAFGSRSINKEFNF